MTRSMYKISMLVGILQNMVNMSLDPTSPDGPELPTFSHGGEGIPHNTVFLHILSIYFPSTVN